MGPKSLIAAGKVVFLATLALCLVGCATGGLGMPIVGLVATFALAATLWGCGFDNQQGEPGITYADVVSPDSAAGSSLSGGSGTSKADGSGSGTAADSLISGCELIIFSSS